MKWIFFAIIFMLSINSFAQTGSIAKGNQFYKNGEFEQAEIHYRKALETHPENAIALHNLSNALYKQKKYEESIKVTATLVKATKDTGLKSAAYYNQGVSNSKLQNLEASIESYKNALRLNPSDKEARENLQKALLQLKNKQQQSQSKQKQSSSMSQKEAEQKLKQLQQKEKELQEKMNKKSGGGQAQDW